MGTLSMVGCGGAPSPAPQVVEAPPARNRPKASCDNFETEMDSVWNDEVLSGLDLAVRIFKGELAASDGERIVSELNAVFEHWVALRTEGCHTYNGDETITDADYDKWTACLDGKRQALSQKLEAFEGGELTALEPPLDTLDTCKL